MKTFIVSTVTIIVAMLIYGCDPTHHVDFKVMNSSEESIKILVDYDGIALDTNIISAGTTLVFFNDYGIGSSTSDYLDRIKTLPVGLSIFNVNGLNFNKNEEDLTNWHKSYPEKKSGGTGSIQLTVRSEDFE